VSCYSLQRVLALEQPASRAARAPVDRVDETTSDSEQLRRSRPLGSRRRRRPPPPRSDQSQLCSAANSSERAHLAQAANPPPSPVPLSPSLSSPILPRRSPHSASPRRPRPSQPASPQPHVVPLARQRAARPRQAPAPSPRPLARRCPLEGRGSARHHDRLQGPEPALGRRQWQPRCVLPVLTPDQRLARPHDGCGGAEPAARGRTALVKAREAQHSIDAIKLQH